MRFLLAFCFIALPALASAQRERYDYSTVVPEAAIQRINLALSSAIGSKHQLASAKTEYTVTEDSVERIIHPRAAVGVHCYGERAVTLIRLIVPVEPVSMQAETSEDSAGYRPMGVARTVAYISSTDRSDFALLGDMLRMLNRVCTQQDKAPHLTVTLWYKSAPDAIIPGFMRETNVELAYASISAKRWSEIMQQR